MSEPSPPRAQHSIDYIEITVDDVAVAKQFYAAAFGWSFSDYGPDYAGIEGQEGGREQGGLCKGTTLRDHAGRTPPLVILYSHALDETVAMVRGAGGTIVKEPYAFPGGRRFHFADPSGNELAVWSET